jgi:hypothetical protein
MSDGILSQPVIDEINRNRLDQLRELPVEHDVLGDVPPYLFDVNQDHLKQILLGWVQDQKTVIQAAITASKCTLLV